MIECSKCKTTKPVAEFQRRAAGKDGYRRTCKSCMASWAKKRGGYSTSAWRRNAKLRLIEAHGGKCMDCGYVGPPYQFQFDHRDPSLKSFGIASYKLGWDRLYEESLKCDLVCTMCHVERTHRQRCSGCDYCN